METGLWLVAVTVVFILIHNQPRGIAAVIVLAMYMTRPAIEVGGFNLRGEMVVGALCGLWLLNVKRSVASMEQLRGSRNNAILLTFVWLAGGALSTWYMAPDWRASFSVLLWCTLNVVTAIWVYKNPESWNWILVYGIRLGALAAVLALSVWALVNVGVTNWGVQVDPAYGGYAAYVTSIEANILGGLLCLWILIAVLKPRGVHLAFSTPVLQLLGPLAIVVTHTRAALIAYFVGLCLIRITGSAKLSSTMVIPLIAGIPLLFTYSNDAGFAKFDSLIDVDTGTGALRFETNSLAFEEWLNVSPVFGLGWNTFGQRHLDPSRPTEAIPSYLGNLPLQIAYDGGAVAVLLVASAVFLTLGRLRRQGRLRYALCLGIPYLVFSISTSALWLLETWLLVGLAWAAGVADERARQPEEAEILAR